MFMFADQDDFWKENKVKDTVEEYKKMRHNKEPILIHTDLNVADDKLNIINKSFIKFSALKTTYNKFNHYLIQNNVTGCTVLINKSLANLISFDIKNICMHDWYFALLASAFGKVIFIDKQTIKYRQHGNNVIGAQSNRGFKPIFKGLKNYKIVKKHIRQLYEQAEAFKENHYKMLNNKNKKIIDDFIKMKKNNKFRKIIIIVKNKFYCQNLVFTLGKIISL